VDFFAVINILLSVIKDAINKSKVGASGKSVICSKRPKIARD